MPHTGEKAPQTGRYKPKEHTHTAEIRIKQGETLPPCAHCHLNIHWEYVGP
jgi:hypothetical protein